MSIQDDFFDLENALEGTPELAALERLWDWSCGNESDIEALQTKLRDYKVSMQVHMECQKTFQTDTVREFMKRAGQNTPKKPTEPTEEERILRAKLILEEALETIYNGLGVSVSVSQEVPNMGNPYVVSTKIEKNSALSLDIEKDFDMIETIDGAEDLRWVGVDGIYALCGVDPTEPREEVNRSNMSKFIDGYRREDGKWVKGPSYSPVDLTDKIKAIV